MNELKKNIGALWKGLAPSQKVSLVASALAVVAVLVGVVYFASQPKMTLLYSNLAPTEASKVADHLQTKKIPFELVDGGQSVMVPANRVYELRLSLASAGIPRASDTAGGVGFEIFDKATFGMSDFMQKANYYRALQGELARTIRQMEEIEEARVMIVVPEDRLFRADQEEAKASVFVKLKSNRTLGEEQVRSVQFLVANGVKGLQADKVAIVDQRGRALATNREGDSLLNSGGNQIELVATVEDRLREKAQSMLDRVLGPGESVVRVSAALDFDAVQETSEKFDPQGAVIRNESITSESSKSETASLGGVAGVTSNLEETKTEGGSGNSNEEARETVNNVYEINRTVESRQRASGTIERISVAVFVNMRKQAVAATAEGETAEAGAPTPRTAQELEALENVVKQAVGFQEGRQDSIQIQEVAFANLFDESSSEPVKQDVMKTVTPFMPYISQGFLALLAIAVFFYFRSILKTPDAEQKDSDFAQLVSKFEQIQTPALNGTNGRNGGIPVSSSSLTVEEMTKLIRENPNNTTQALKQWLTRN